MKKLLWGVLLVPILVVAAEKSFQDELRQFYEEFLSQGNSEDSHLKRQPVIKIEGSRERELSISKFTLNQGDELFINDSNTIKIEPPELGTYTLEMTCGDKTKPAAEDLLIVFHTEDGNTINGTWRLTEAYSNDDQLKESYIENGKTLLWQVKSAQTIAQNDTSIPKGQYKALVEVLLRDSSGQTVSREEILLKIDRT